MDHFPRGSDWSLTDTPESGVARYLDITDVDVSFITAPQGTASPGSLACDAADFGKWIRTHRPEVSFRMPKPVGIRVQRSDELSIGLLVLGQKIAVDVFVGLVVAYLADKTRGALKGDEKQVEFEVVFRSTRSTKTKTLKFKGTEAALKDVLGELQSIDLDGAKEDPDGGGAQYNKG